MSQPAQPIEADAFLASLRDRTADGMVTIALDGGELPVSVRLRESSSLVFTFSGAVDRVNHTLPRFAALGLDDHVPASIIGISDPSLARNDDMKLAWYAGHEGFELQTILPELFRQMIESLGATRVAFVGSSGGGFAALYYSWQIPGSVAVVSNPQTNLNRYNRGLLESYRAACWPSLGEDGQLEEKIAIDLGPLYAKRCVNTMIYLQVASDFYHIRRHFAPFVSGLPGKYADRLIVRVANWGRRGHIPVPATIWIPWVNAALAAPETTAASIERTWADQNPLAIPPLNPLPRTGRNEPIVTATKTASVDQKPSRHPAAEPPTRPGGRDEQIAAELARDAIGSLLGSRSSEMNVS
jgi:pimeloyl-ACP methyl ester carboxylesterase